MTKPRARMPAKARAQRGLAALVALASLAAVSGCAPSPTTTYVDKSGTEVTVDWADYPGSPGIDATDVLSAPPKEQIEQVETALIAEIKQALSAEFDLDWRREREGQWFPYGGNGYGGESAYVVYNSPDYMSDTVPRGADDWRLAVDIVSEITESLGLGPIALDHELAGLDDRLEQFGDGEADDYWQWTGTAYGTSQWISIALTDVSKDESGDAAEEWRDDGWPPQSIAISYGATTLPAGERAEFERRLAPFAGLDPPPGTTSD